MHIYIMFVYMCGIHRTPLLAQQAWTPNAGEVSRTRRGVSHGHGEVYDESTRSTKVCSCNTKVACRKAENQICDSNIGTS